MFEFAIGDDSTTTIVGSPSEALLPRTIKDELSGEILSQHSLATDLKLPPLFQKSPFTNAVNEKDLTDKLDATKQEGFKFTYEKPPPRTYTLTEALDLQVSKLEAIPAVSYRTVSETIIHTICESLDLNSANACSLIRSSNTRDKIAQIIQEFVSKNIAIQTDQLRQEINFGTTSTRSPDKTVLGFYTKILPIDLVERAKEKFDPKGGSLTRCVAVTNKEMRCKNKSNLDELAFDSLVRELSSMPKPRHFSKVAKILSDIVDMVFCTGSHLKKARFAIHDLCEHFHKDIKSSSREIELKCLDQWL